MNHLLAKIRHFYQKQAVFQPYFCIDKNEKDRFIKIGLGLVKGSGDRALTRVFMVVI